MSGLAYLNIPPTTGTIAQLDGADDTELGSASEAEARTLPPDDQLGTDSGGGRVTGANALAQITASLEKLGHERRKYDMYDWW
jgi:hypothetical protein